MTDKKIITSLKAPKAIGPYSIGVQACHFIFASGQAGIDPATGELVHGGIENETRQTLLNLQAVLEAGGSSLSQVVKTTVFLSDIHDFAVMNRVYSTFFPDNPPARSTVQVAALPKGAAVEIELIAFTDASSLD